MRRSSQVLTLLIVFSIGAIGGIWAQAFLLPVMASNPSLAQLQFIKDWNARTQIITPVQEIVITQDEAIARAVQRLDDVVVGIRSVAGASVREGSGLLYTSDGLVVTLASLVPQFYQIQVYVGDSIEPITDVQVVKRDVVNNLALLKIEGDGLPTTGFSNEDAVAVGEPVFLIGKVKGLKGIETRANQGIVTAVNVSGILTNMQDEPLIVGSPVFTMKGDVVGLALLRSTGMVKTITLSELKEFLGL